MVDRQLRAEDIVLSADTCCCIWTEDSLQARPLLAPHFFGTRHRPMHWPCLRERQGVCQMLAAWKLSRPYRTAALLLHAQCSTSTASRVLSLWLFCRGVMLRACSGRS